LYSGDELWRLRVFRLALAALALVLFGAYDSYPSSIALDGLCFATLFTWRHCYQEVSGIRLVNYKSG